MFAEIISQRFYCERPITVVGNPEVGGSNPQKVAIALLENSRYIYYLKIVLIYYMNTIRTIN